MTILIATGCAVGAAVLLALPKEGPTAWLRDDWLRPVLGQKAGKALDCVRCCSFWFGLAFGALAWQTGEPLPWAFAPCLLAPAVIWAVMATK